MTKAPNRAKTSVKFYRFNNDLSSLARKQFEITTDPKNTFLTVLDASVCVYKMLCVCVSFFGAVKLLVRNFIALSWLVSCCARKTNRTYQNKPIVWHTVSHFGKQILVGVLLIGNRGWLGVWVVKRCVAIFCNNVEYAGQV